MGIDDLAAVQRMYDPFEESNDVAPSSRDGASGCRVYCNCRVYRLMEGESLPFLREDVFSDFWWTLEMVA